MSVGCIAHHTNVARQPAVGTIKKSVNAHANAFLPFAIRAVAVAFAIALFQVALSANHSMVHGRLRFHFNMGGALWTSREFPLDVGGAALGSIQILLRILGETL